MSRAQHGPVPGSVTARDIEALFRSVGSYGDTGDGGCNRPAFSAGERAAREALARYAGERGYRAFRDELGSVFVVRPGSESVDVGGARSGEGADTRGGGDLRGDAEAVYTGSHLDTVPAGGCFDGASGVLCGLAAFELLDMEGVSTPRPLVLVSWANEEGARFSPATMGSGVFTGALSMESALSSVDADGVPLRDELKYETVPQAEPPAPAAYVELHPEQGRQLERAGVPLGVVEGVQGQVAGDWTMTGRADHAGTTPMDDRSDALVAAIEVVQAAAETASEHPPGVATVGQIRVNPGARNVVPGSVHGTLDIRHPNDEAVRDMLAEIRRRAERAAGGHDCVFEWTQAWLSEAVEFDSRVVRAVENACTKRRYPAIRLSSGAGHDAVHLSSVCPTGMVFVPSRDGISHSPKEHTPFQDLAIGATVLADVLVALASSEMAARKSW